MNGFSQIMGNTENRIKLKGTKCKFCNVICKNKICINRNCAMHQLNKTPLLNDSDLQNYDKILDNRELVNIIRILEHRCSKMEKEIETLKTKTNTKVRIQIIDILNNVSNIPKMQYCNWFRNIIITREILLSVFENDLNDGIKNAILHDMRPTKKSASKILPVQAFAQKPNCFYIYDCLTPKNDKPTTSYSDIDTNNIKPDPKWTVIPNDYIEKMVLHISFKILAEFLVWQDENRAKIKRSENMQNDEINYMTKINGYGTTIEKRSIEIKKWLYGIIAQDIKPMIKPEYE
jgi:hypothetical protein